MDKLTVKDYDGKEFWAGFHSAGATIKSHGLDFTQEFLRSKERCIHTATEPAIKSYWFGYGYGIVYHIWH